MFWIKNIWILRNFSHEPFKKGNRRIIKDSLINIWFGSSLSCKIGLYLLKLLFELKEKKSCAEIMLLIVEIGDKFCIKLYTLWYKT